MGHIAHIVLGGNNTCAKSAESDACNCLVMLCRAAPAAVNKCIITACSARQKVTREDGESKWTCQQRFRCWLVITNETVSQATYTPYLNGQ